MAIATKQACNMYPKKMRVSSRKFKKGKKVAGSIVDNTKSKQADSELAQFGDRVKRLVRPTLKTADDSDGLTALGMMGAGLGSVGGAIGGASAAPHGRRFEGAMRGGAQGLGAITGLGAGSIGGLYLASLLERHSPLAARLAFAGGGIGGGMLGHHLVNKLIGPSSWEQEAEQYKMGSVGSALLGAGRAIGKAAPVVGASIPKGEGLHSKLWGAAGMAPLATMAAGAAHGTAKPLGEGTNWDRLNTSIAEGAGGMAGGSIGMGLGHQLGSYTLGGKMFDAMQKAKGANPYPGMSVNLPQNESYRLKALSRLGGPRFGFQNINPSILAQMLRGMPKMFPGVGGKAKLLSLLPYLGTLIGGGAGIAGTRALGSRLLGKEGGIPYRIAKSWYTSGEDAFPKPHEYHGRFGGKQRQHLRDHDIGSGSKVTHHETKDASMAGETVGGAPHMGGQQQMAMAPAHSSSTPFGSEFIHPTLFHGQLGAMAAQQGGGPKPAMPQMTPATQEGIQGVGQTTGLKSGAVVMGMPRHEHRNSGKMPRHEHKRVGMPRHENRTLNMSRPTHLKLTGGMRHEALHGLIHLLKNVAGHKRAAGESGGKTSLFSFLGDLAAK